MPRRIQKIIILGGGTAGWMSAAYLAKALGETTSITVIEAPAIPRIGVGEASIPNLQKVFFDYLGLAENEWMPECNGAFKMAVKFINWRTEGEGQPTARSFNGQADQFYHPFGVLPHHDGVPLSHYWSHDRLRGVTDEPFDYACYREPAVMDALRAPRHLDGRPATRYAWHFDAHLLADFLRRHATERLGVHHLQDEMTRVLMDERGFITALATKGGAMLDGDLFIDCSGFRGLLINKALGEPFIDMGDQLLCDSAVATAVPHDDATYGVEPFTSAIAMKAGWTWRIPMLGRFGTGYVYSSRFTERDKATLDLCRLWELDPDRAPLQHVRFRVGRNRRAWVNNCVSIGLSSCFLEPLESTGIFFITAAIYHLVKYFPDGRFDPTLIGYFNRDIETMFDDTKNFIQAHFVLSPRKDSPFWRANKELHLPDQMREIISGYRAGLAVNMPTIGEADYYGNFDAEFRNFWTNGNYYCIFSGLGLLPDRSLPLLGHRPDSVAAGRQLMERVRVAQRDLVRSLPTNYDCLRRLHGNELLRDPRLAGAEHRFPNNHGS